MFGMGGSEIIVILIVALLFLGPDKLPQATKQISKTIRDLKKQSRALQQQIEGDEQIGGAIRDLKSALRGEEIPTRSVRPPRKAIDGDQPATENSIAGAGPPEVKELTAGETTDAVLPDVPPLADVPPLSEVPVLAETKPVTLPAEAGESDGPAASAEDDAELASLIKPASGTVAKGS